MQPRMILASIGTALALGWPLLVHWLQQHVDGRLLLAGGALLLLWRLPRLPALLAIAALLALGVFGSTRLGVHGYPVLVNLAMLYTFGASLLHGPPLVERLARLREPELSPRAIAYTRRVTQAWCLFFAINGAIAGFTVLRGDPVLWALYNGVISYLLIALMFCVEWLVRRRVQRADPQCSSA